MNPHIAALFDEGCKQAHPRIVPRMYCPRCWAATGLEWLIPFEGYCKAHFIEWKCEQRLAKHYAE